MGIERTGLFPNANHKTSQLNTVQFFNSTEEFDLPVSVQPVVTIWQLTQPGRKILSNLYSSRARPECHSFSTAAAFT